MNINLLTSLREGETINSRFFTFNMTVAWFLRKAFRKKGVRCRFVWGGQGTHTTAAPLPKADHTIAISGVSMLVLRGTGRQGKPYPPKIRKLCKRFRGLVRKATRGKITIYLDADYSGWAPYFDHIFTVVKPRPKASKKYVYAGWGADPKHCYPRQKRKAIFIDSLMYGYYKGRFKEIYRTYARVLPTLKYKVHNPWPRYHGSKRILWTKVQAILRQSHFYCCTQLGESGLTRIEAATCGALLVVPRPMYKPRTMASLEHKIWNTPQDLVRILKSKTDPRAIRKKALQHSWDKVVYRILKAL